MNEKLNIFYLSVLAILFTVALTFLTLDAPIYLNRLIIENIDIPDYNPAITPDLIEEFIVKNNLRPIGYGSIVLVIILVAVGFVTRRSNLATLGSAILFLPTFGYFVSYMFFLSGLGILRLMYIPLWSTSIDLMRLGDIIYLPYIVITYPLSLLLSILTLDVNSPFFRFLLENRIIHYYMGGFHIDPRPPLAFILILLGLFIFTSSSLAWFITNFNRKTVANFWLYKYSRHPQYLGWIIWSYGVMLLASLTPVVRGGANPGASLPWMLSNIIVISIALKEEIHMTNTTGEEYSKYMEKTPFLFPLPDMIKRIMQFPFKLITKKNYPENTRDIITIFLLYSIILMLTSLPFILMSWPSPMGWSNWPFMLWPFNLN